MDLTKSVIPSPSKTPTARILSSDLVALAPENEWLGHDVLLHELRPSGTLMTG